MGINTEEEEKNKLNWDIIAFASYHKKVSFFIRPCFQACDVKAEGN